MMDKKGNQQLSEDIIISSLSEKIPVDEIVSFSNNKSSYKQFIKENPKQGHALLLLSLTNEAFSEGEAKKYWKNIQAHRNKINTCLERDVGIAVAALDYMTNIKEILSDPILIEEDKSQNITDIATNDLLTGLITRDVFDIILKKEINRIKRKNKILSIALIDIDDFKKVNDTYGHQKGDDILSAVGNIINDNVREMDVAARYGGEELVVLMLDTDMDTAYQVVERIRDDIEKYDSDDVSVTVSIGITESIKTDDVNSFIKRADEALYQAKAGGKNVVYKSTD